MSGSVNKQSLIRKLSTLSTTQDSIQSLSLWLFHFAKDADTIVQIWLQELKQAPANQKLKFIFLANDVILQGRKKGMAYVTAFKPVLPEALPHVFRTLDEKGRQQLARIISIWQDRAAYPVDYLNELRKALRGSLPSSSDELKDVDLGSPINKPELFSKVAQHEEDLPKLSKAMEQIRALPAVIFDDRPIENVKTRTELERLEGSAKKAQANVDALIKRLRTYLEEGEQLHKEVNRCTMQEKQAVAQAQLRVEQCKERLKKLTHVRKQLKEHVESLPDVHADAEMSAALPDPSELFDVDTGGDDAPPAKTAKRAV